MNLLAKYSIHVHNNKYKRIDFSTEYRWDSSWPATFQNTLCHPICKKSINEFLEKKRLDNVDDPDIPTSEIVSILDRAALSANKKSKKKTNKSFDNDVRSKRNTLVEKGDLLSRSPCNPIIRGSYYKCYRKYNKLRKYKKRHFKQTILDGLDRLRDSDPKTYSKLINSLKYSNNNGKTNHI